MLGFSGDLSAGPPSTELAVLAAAACHLAPGLSLNLDLSSLCDYESVNKSNTTLSYFRQSLILSILMGAYVPGQMREVGLDVQSWPDSLNFSLAFEGSGCKSQGSPAYSKRQSSDARSDAR